MWERSFWKLGLGFAIIFLATGSIFGAGLRYEITITNLTKGPCGATPPSCAGQVFSSPVVAIHNDSMEPLYTLGSPASEELAVIAEDALNIPLLDVLSGDRAVIDSGVIPGEHTIPLPAEFEDKTTLIFPGESATAVFNTYDGYEYGAGQWRLRGRISLVGMLVSTNDAFYGLDSAPAPTRVGESVEYYLNAYDAGSEGNDELCTHVPGPPCGSLSVRSGNGEGFVYVHAGILGIGDLPTGRSWLNPVAKVVITAIR